MAESLDTSLDKHKEWTEYINERLEVIYKEICEYEKIISKQTLEDTQPISLLELLERINELHEAAEDLSPVNTELREKAIDLNKQIDSLQNTMELLKLELPSVLPEESEEMAD